MQDSIGTNAGLVWQYLEEHGPATTMKLKSALGIPSSMLYLALGWLEREGKIEMTEEAHAFRISLKREP